MRKLLDKYNKLLNEQLDVGRTGMEIDQVKRPNTSIVPGSAPAPPPTCLRATLDYACGWSIGTNWNATVCPSLISGAAPYTTNNCIEVKDSSGWRDPQVGDIVVPEWPPGSGLPYDTCTNYCCNGGNTPECNIMKLEVTGVVSNSLITKDQWITTDCTPNCPFPTTDNSHEVFELEVCDSGTLGWNIGQILSFNPISNNNGLICNGAMCTNSDLGQTFESNTPPGFIGYGTGVKYKLLSFSSPVNASNVLIDIINTTCPSSNPCDPSYLSNAFPPSFGTYNGFPGFGIGACRACGLGPFSIIASPTIPNSVPSSTPSPSPNFATLGDVCNYIDTNSCC